MNIEIIKAEYCDNYNIKLEFMDKTTRVINFENFLKQAQNPLTRKYLEIKHFKEFTIEYGDLIWNDYELCFPIYDLYYDKISNQISLLAL